MHTVAHLITLLRIRISESGHSKAGYYLGEEPAAHFGGPAGHYSRRQAAHALREGWDVTLDFGYNGQLDAVIGSETVRLSHHEGVLVRVSR